MVQDAILVAVTGLSSLLYHGNNSAPSVFQQIFNTRGIRNADVVLSYLLTFHTTHMAVFKRKQRRLELTILMIPIAVYMGEDDLSILLFILLYHSIIGICYSIYLKHKMKWMMLGYLFGIVDIGIMWLGDFVYKDQYYWIHGTHHITCFCAIACIIKTISPFQKELDDMEMVSLTSETEIYTSPKLKHRRSFSMTNALTHM